MTRSAREDQIVVGQLLLILADGLSLQIDRFDAPEPHFDVAGVPELHADGHGDVGGIQAGGRNLVEQRLEEMMIAVIDEDDLEVLAIGELPGRVQAPEARPDDDRESGHHSGHAFDPH